MTAELLNLRSLSDEGLAHFHAYWTARLNHRGGSWVCELLREAARDQLADIALEVERRARTLTESEPRQA